MQPASTAQADRRIVTIVFADISGFTVMSERMDPELVTGIMNECFERLAVIIRKYEGTIDKFIGDSVMVLFGAPVAMEDAPHRALNASIEMREELERYTSEKRLAFPLSLHIGVNTGEVIYGAVGSRGESRETAMGDAVNLASRLEDASRAGQILVGPETYRRTVGQFELISMGPMELKGKEERVPVWELRSRKPSACRNRSATSQEIRSALVGRERELDRLELQALKALNGEGSMVHVIGEAGIGKSRLIAEFRERVAGRKVTLLEGRALSTGGNLGYHLFDDLLRRWCRINEDETPAESMRKLEGLVAELVGEEAEEVLPLVALLTGMKLSAARQDRVSGIEPQSLASIIASKFRQLLAAAARRAALVLVFEDLHWADTSSIELAESLFRLAEAAPVMFVTVSRPGFEESSGRIHRFTGDKFPTLVVELHLDSLSERESSELLRGLTRLEEFPQALQDRIFAQAGGNPFFVEEIVRSLLGRGSLEMKDGAIRLWEGAETFPIPSTVNEVIMSRFDRLEEGLKDLLRMAAVIGKAFFRTILERLSDPAQDLDQGIARLKGLQMIRESKRQEEIEYVFAHAVVQETIYHSILLQRRRALHQKVAEAIEASFADRLQEFYGLLAYHYGQSEEEVKAEEYLALAGEEALKTSASSEATVFLTKALELYLRRKSEGIDPLQAAQLVSGIARAHAMKGDIKEAVPYFRQALSYLGVRPTRTGPKAILGALAGFVRFLALLFLRPVRRRRSPSDHERLVLDLQYQEAEALTFLDITELLLMAAPMLGRIGQFEADSIPYATKWYCGAAGVLSAMGVFGIAKRTLEYAAARMNEHIIRDRYVLNTQRLYFGFTSGARPLTYDRSMNMAMIRAGDFLEYVTFTYNSALHEIETGDLANAAEIIVESTALGQEFDHRHIRYTAASVSIAFTLKTRSLAETIDEYLRLESILKGFGSDALQVPVHACLAQAEILRGEFDEAGRILQSSKEILGRSGYVAPAYLGQHEVACLQLAVARLGKAIESREPVGLRNLSRECGECGHRAAIHSKKMANARVETYRFIGLWLWLIDKPKRAFTWWGRSVDEGLRLGYRLELSRTYFEIGRRLRSAPPNRRTMCGIDSEGWLAKAEALFREIGLEKDLEELRELRA